MPSLNVNGIDLCYETSGSGEPLLLVNGLGSQLIAWDEELLAQLVDRGFAFTRFDNRDVGLSTKFAGAPKPDMGALLGGDDRTAPYRIADMAADAAGLIEALELAPVNALGVSMGGMIVQQLAIDRPDLVRSVCSIMSTTGDPSVGRATREAREVLMTPPPRDRDLYLDYQVRVWKVIGSPGFPFDEAGVRRRYAAIYDRAFYPQGTGRQLAAVTASPDRTEALHGVRIPTLVIHGEEDALINVSGGRATAAAVPGAELLLIPGMGHDLPSAVWDQLLDAIVANTHRETAAA